MNKNLRCGRSCIYKFKMSRSSIVCYRVSDLA